MPPPVTLMEAGGLPRVNTLGAVPHTVVGAGAVGITLVDDGAPPVTLLNEDGTLWSSFVDEITNYLNGITPYHYADYISNRMLYAGEDVGDVTGGTGYSFTRASEGTYRNADGTTTTFTSGQLRRGNRGVLIEGARTNLFLNSATGATQSITVAATAYTLSFEGTGTVTLSGVSTAGPLVGTGALDRVSLTFTPTAGSLTLTITGTVERVNLEAGAFGSSWIPTTGTSATRAADVLTYTAGVDYPLTMWAEFERAVDTGELEAQLQIDIGNNFDYARLAVNSADAAVVTVSTNNVLQGSSTVTGTINVGSITKLAARIQTDDVMTARGGTLGGAQTSVTLPAAPTVFRIGARTTTANQAFGYIRKIAIIQGAQNDAALQGMTS
jgi:hypothetical protein